MQVDIEKMVIVTFICLAMLSLAITCGIGAEEEEPDPNGLFAVRYSAIDILVRDEGDEVDAAVVEKLKSQERRIIRLELIIDRFKSLAEELDDPMFETEMDTAVDEVMAEEPSKSSWIGTGILIGALILLVIGIAVLTIRLSRR